MMFLPFLFLIFLSLNFHVNFASKNEPSLISMPTNKFQTYIVHVKQPEVGVLGESWHTSFLRELVPETSNELPQLLYSYRNVISGFAARLTEEQVKAMEKKDGFISAVPDSLLDLHTTYTPDYLGLNQQSGLWKNSNFGKGVIIGVLDTGITPGHPSFRDDGLMPPPPAKWKGRCELNASFCNNKLIGARSFNLGNNFLTGESPADVNGHGTHTASTAAGAFVRGADALGNADGTAIGIAPLAHIAVYKVCTEGCPNSDILAGLDAAIDDGVDVLSLSLGGKSVPFFKDVVAKGTYAAIQKGIFVSCSAGNSGPSKSTLSNEAPWILTVGASTIDRRIVAVAKLGNGEEFEGESLFQPHDYTSPFLPLVYAGKSENQTAVFCGEGSLTNIDVKGKVVVCEMGGGVGRTAKGKTVKKAGGVAMILINGQSGGFTTLSDAHVLPATHVSFEAGLKIKAYIFSTKNPTASILFKGTIIKDSSSDPAMAYFSSRGPSLQSPGILKPDITGPGVNILAAWPFRLDNTKSSTKSTFNVISGTSMSCPHLSGIVALIKSSHPNWSPAAIKSAIMTTAKITNPRGNPILDQELEPANLFAMGAGHVNPSAAVDPGLVYDITPIDYIAYLCGLYEDSQVSLIVGRTIICSTISKIEEGELNYPSFTVALGMKKTLSRTVTNVGEARSNYWADIEAPTGVSVSVSPRRLAFFKVNQKVKYWVSFTRNGSVEAPIGEYSEGYIKWVSGDGKHVVTSPISVKFLK